MAAPITLELVELDPEGMLDSAVEDLGKVFVSSELGGGGTATPETLAIAETAVRNFLAHHGVIDETAVSRAARGLPPSREMHMPETGCYLIADEAGLHEPLVDLLAEVEAGSPLGQIHFPDRPDRAPVVCRAGTSGTLIGRTHKVLVGPGDFLALVAHDR